MTNNGLFFSSLPERTHNRTVWIWKCFTESQCVHTVRLGVLSARVTGAYKLQAFALASAFPNMFAFFF